MRARARVVIVWWAQMPTRAVQATLQWMLQHGGGETVESGTLGRSGDFTSDVLIEKQREWCYTGRGARRDGYEEGGGLG